MNHISNTFEIIFDASPSVVVNAPGRINLIGEHTDYNGGWVMPAAIDLSISFALALSTQEKSTIYSEDFKESISINHLQLDKTAHQWHNYFIGCLDLLQIHFEKQLPNFNLAFSSKIPLGAGLSSSAALTCGFISGLNELFDLKLDKWQIARLAQQCEHQYIGVNCGIMDQFAVVFGVENSALQLNCASLNFHAYEFDLKNYQWLLCNSLVSHNLTDSAYNERRSNCEKALQILNTKGHKYTSISEASMPDLVLFDKDSDLYFNVLHVLTENQRVQELTEALLDKNFTKAGGVLNQSHISLKENYKVTCEETDFLFERINAISGVAGCRQMGGGFGGCMLILVQKNTSDSLMETISTDYKAKIDITPSFYKINLSGGVQLFKY